MRRILLPAALLAVLSACFGGGDDETVFPAGLEPLEANKAEFPADGSETLALASGEGEEWDWTHARGYVHAPLALTWEALQQPEVDVDRRRVEEYEVTFDVEPDYSPSYRIDQKVVDIVTVEYSLTWRHGEVEPGVAAVRWQKTEGSALIELLEGSITLTGDEETTAIEIVEHLGSPAQDDIESMELYLTDLHASVVAYTNGEDLPTYD
jgi:hypothetical protein